MKNYEIMEATFPGVNTEIILKKFMGIDDIRYNLILGEKDEIPFNRPKDAMQGNHLGGR
jgi:hypothetical protein